MRTKKFSKKYPKGTYDYICLDEDHSYKVIKTDFKLFWSKLNHNGYLCLHDIHLLANFMGLEFSYEKFCKELIVNINFRFKFELSNHYSGLGYLQKI